MLGTFDANHPVVLTFPCVDEAGRTLTVTAASYSVVDEVGAVVKASAAVGTFTSGDPQVDITVAAVDNALAIGSIEAVRKVTVVMTTAAGDYTISQLYIIEAEAVLIAGDNSIQTYEQALLAARHISDLAAWNSATEPARKTALSEAYEAMCSFQIRTLTPEFSSDRNAGQSVFGLGDANLISELEATDLDLLDDRLILALRKTQVAQADFVLTRISTERLMRDGVQSQTVGESSQFFSPRAPLKLPLCKKALEILGPWIVWRVRLGRG